MADENTAAATVVKPANIAPKPLTTSDIARQIEALGQSPKAGETEKKPDHPKLVDGESPEAIAAAARAQEATAAAAIDLEDLEDKKKADAEKSKAESEKKAVEESPEAKANREAEAAAAMDIDLDGGGTTATDDDKRKNEWEALPDWAKRDIQEGRTKAKELKEQVEAAEAKAKAAVAAAPAADNSPLSKITTPQELETEAGKWRNIKRNAGRILDNPDSFQENEKGEKVFTTQVEGKPVEYTRQMLQQLRDSAEDMLESHIPQRREFLHATTAWDSKAVEVYPALKNPNSKLAQTVENTIAANPWVRSHPGYRMLVAHNTIMAAVCQRGLLPKVIALLNDKSSAPNKVPPNTPTRKQAAPAKSEHGAGQGESLKKFTTSGSTDALAAHLSQHMRSQ